METTTFNKSENLKGYQTETREKTYYLIDEAISHLREFGIPLTKKAIAEEIGIHPNTLSKPHVREYLSKYPEFSPKHSVNLEAENENLKAQIKTLEDRLAHSRNNNARLTQENDAIRKDRDEYKFKYKRLLGRYQIDVGKKITNL